MEKNMADERRKTPELVLKNISKMVGLGLINKEFGEILAKNIIKSDGQKISQNASIHKDFLENRQNLKKYLIESGVNLSKGEFEKIYNLVLELENGAVDRFLKSRFEGEKNSSGKFQKIAADVIEAKKGEKGAEREILEKIGEVQDVVKSEVKKNELQKFVSSLLAQMKDETAKNLILKAVQGAKEAGCEAEPKKEEKNKTAQNEGGIAQDVSQDVSQEVKSPDISRLQTLSAQECGKVAQGAKNFTLDEIGKMSPKEFKKYEAIINKQLKEGLL